MNYIFKILFYFLFTVILINADDKLANKKYIFLGNENIEPLIFKENNQTKGLVIDLTKEILKAANINATLDSKEWNLAQKLLNNNQIDALLQINKNLQRDKIYDFSLPLLESRFNIYKKDSNFELTDIQSLQNKIIGVEQKGYPYSLLKKYPNVKIFILNSWLEGFRLIKEGKIDGLIVDNLVGDYVLETNNIKGIRKASLPLETSYSHIAVKKGNKELLNKINNGIKIVTLNGTKDSIIKKWLYPNNKIRLTNIEKEWLDQNHIVRVRVGNWPPFQIHKNDNFEGIAVDYIKYIFEKHNINYKFVSSKDIFWSDALKSIRDKKEIDLILTATITKDRLKDMLFTDNYISAPWVIFTRNDYNFILGIKDLYGKKVAVQDGFVMKELLENNHPKIALKVTQGSASTKDALQMLAVGEVDAYIGNLAIGSYISKELNFNNIKVAAPTEFGEHKNAMAIRNDWAALVSILNKELLLISTTKKDEIYNKYLSIRYDHGIEKKDIFKWFGTGLVLFVLVSLIYFIINKKLKIEVEKKTKELNNINQNLETKVVERTKELKDLNQELEKISLKDPLTGIANRLCFNTQLLESIRRHRRFDKSLSLLMIDIDDFKAVNDTYGHQVGDEYLIKVASVLKKNLHRVGDLVCRFGGEEFVVILEDTNLDGAKIIAEKIRKGVISLSLENKNSPTEKYLTISIGASSTNPDENCKPEQIVKIADEAMYEAKKNGKNRVVGKFMN